MDSDTRDWQKVAAIILYNCCDNVTTLEALVVRYVSANTSPTHVWAGQGLLQSVCVSVCVCYCFTTYALYPTVATM